VIQTENNYDKGVFNGDIGQVVSIDPEERELLIRFEERDVLYDFNELDELSLAYAITIHKSQGSEFPAVVVPLAMQHYLLLQRNLVYTAMTRGRRFVVLVGQRKAFATIVLRNDFQAYTTDLSQAKVDPSGRDVIRLADFLKISMWGVGNNAEYF
jgi:exodeoxyribonuclease V alpha subunit